MSQEDSRRHRTTSQRPAERIRSDCSEQDGGPEDSMLAFDMDVEERSI